MLPYLHILTIMYVRDSCSKQLDSDRPAADVPEDLVDDEQCLSDTYTQLESEAEAQTESETEPEPDCWDRERSRADARIDVVGNSGCSALCTSIHTCMDSGRHEQ
jgi:hypothetical protein